MGAATALDDAFAALADPTRRDIVARLSVVQDASVSELAKPYGMSLQAVSKHLRVLQDAGLVTRSRRGRERPASLDGEVLSMLTGWLERRRRELEARHQSLDAALAELEPPHPRHRPTGDTE